MQLNFRVCIPKIVLKSLAVSLKELETDVSPEARFKSSIPTCGDDAYVVCVRAREGVLLLAPALYSI